MALVRAKRKRPMIVTNALDEMRLEDVSAEFLEQFNDRQNTFRAYSTDISQFSDYLKLVECDSVYGPIVGDLTITNAANYLASLKNKFALSTIERKGDALTYKLHVKTIYRIVRYYCIKAGVREKAAHPHALRHTFGIRSAAHLSIILGTGRALSALKEMMGHSNINTTAIYLTHEDTELQRAMEGMC